MMNKRIFTRSAQAGLLALSAMVGTQANAGLFLEVTGGFTCDNPSSPGGQADLTCLNQAQSGSVPNTYQRVEWTDDDDPRSSLELSFNNPTELENGVLSDVFEMAVQTNNVIDGPFEWELDIDTRIVFENYDGVELFNDIATVGVLFNETLNEAPCSLGNPAGSICDDRYRLTFDENFIAPIEFMDDEFLYSVVFIPEVTNGVIVPVSFNTVDLFTEEVDQSMLAFRALATKTPKEIPTPAPLALLAIGAIGLSALRRRKQLS